MLHSIQLSQAYFDEAATEDPDLAAKYTMGNIMLQKGCYDQALSLHKEALATYCETMGPDHLTSSDSWNKLGCILSMPKFADQHIGEAE